MWAIVNRRLGKTSERNEFRLCVNNNEIIYEKIMDEIFVEYFSASPIRILNTHFNQHLVQHQAFLPSSHLRKKFQYYQEQEN